MEVLVYTFSTKDSGVIICIDNNKDNAIEIVKAIESNWLHGKYNPPKNGNIIVKLFNGDYYGFNPSSFNSFLFGESTKEEMVALRKAMANGDIDSQGIKLIGMDGIE